MSWLCCFPTKEKLTQTKFGSATIRSSMDSSADTNRIARMHIRNTLPTPVMDNTHALTSRQMVFPATVSPSIERLTTLQPSRQGSSRQNVELPHRGYMCRFSARDVLRRGQEWIGKSPRLRFRTKVVDLGYRESAAFWDTPGMESKTEGIGQL